MDKLNESQALELYISVSVLVLYHPGSSVFDRYIGGVELHGSGPSTNSQGRDDWDLTPLYIRSRVLQAV